METNINIYLICICVLGLHLQKFWRVLACPGIYSLEMDYQWVWNVSFTKLEWGLSQTCLIRGEVSSAPALAAWSVENSLLISRIFCFPIFCVFGWNKNKRMWRRMNRTFWFVESSNRLTCMPAGSAFVCSCLPKFSQRSQSLILWRHQNLGFSVRGWGHSMKAQCHVTKKCSLFIVFSRTPTFSDLLWWYYSLNLV